MDDELFIDEPWGNHFSLQKTREGEVLTITACAVDSSFIYIYDMADRSLVIFDSDGIFSRKLNLESIGRATYVGDDFVIRNNEAIFLNCVDKRLEYFNLSTGQRKKSLPYPSDYIKSPQRSHSIINRIFIDQGKLFLGNSHALFCFDETGLSKQSRSTAIMRSPDNKKILLYNSRRPVTRGPGSAQWSGKEVNIRKSHYPMLGKQIAILGNTLISCTVDQHGVQMFRTR